MTRSLGALFRTATLAAALLVGGTAAAQERSTLTIGYLDLTDDPRYLDWGVHPIDIRTGEDLYNRWAYAGAQVGLEDIKPLGGFAEVEFGMEQFRSANAAEMIEALRSANAEGIEFFLVDAPTDVVAEVAAATTDLDILLLNVSARGDSLRNEQCRAHLMHTAPSEAMLMDALVQYLVDQKWREILVLQGPLTQDEKTVEALRRSTRLFGGDIDEVREFVLSEDPRAREMNDLAFLTGRADYEVVFVADTDGEFALTVPYATVRPVPVVGASGLVPRAWHWSFLRHGAPQVHGRFQRMHGRRMNSNDWGAWVAMRAIGEAVIRTRSSALEEVVGYLKSEDLKLDGSKGPPLNFRPWNNQLRQPILLTTENWTVARAPLEAFVHRTNNLDTLGVDARESRCEL